MSNANVNVTLDVRNQAANSGDGYTSTTASNNAVYSYRYTGGTDGAGGVEESVTAGAGSITVSIVADPRYRISNVSFSGDIESQLSWQQQTPTTIVITDSDTSTGEGEYTIVVTDTSANCTLPCDPPIKNKPNK